MFDYKWKIFSDRGKNLEEFTVKNAKTVYLYLFIHGLFYNLGSSSYYKALTVE
jgi:hypothetical protein